MKIIFTGIFFITFIIFSECNGELSEDVPMDFDDRQMYEDGTEDGTDEDGASSSAKCEAPKYQDISGASTCGWDFMVAPPKFTTCTEGECCYPEGKVQGVCIEGVKLTGAGCCLKNDN